MTFDDPGSGVGSLTERNTMLEPEDDRKAGADRPPTHEEVVAADSAAEDIDVDAVGERFEHMTDIGAHIKGEGQIEPEAD